jgi:FOG: Ankyrin repeat
MSAQDTEAGQPNALTRELWHIAGTGDVEQLDRLLNQGAEVNAVDRSGVTALMRAAYHGQLPMVRALIAHGADPNSADRGGLTALTMAKHAGHKEIAEALLSSGAQAKTNSARKPRMVGHVTHEEVGAVENHEPAPGVNTSTARKLDEPEEIEVQVHPVIAAENISDVTASRTPQLRTLHEPPEIWDLVQATPTESHPAPAQRRVSLPILLMLGGVLIICAAVSGWWYLRRAGISPSAPGALKQEAVTTKSTSPSPQVTVAPKAETREARITEKPNETLNRPADKGASERAVTANAPAATLVGLPAKKTDARTRNRAADSATALSSGKDNNFSHDRNGNARERAKSVGGPAKESVQLKKDSNKAQSQQTSDPPKSNVTKPKLIQWP